MRKFRKRIANYHAHNAREKRLTQTNKSPTSDNAVRINHRAGKRSQGPTPKTRPAVFRGELTSPTSKPAGTLKKSSLNRASGYGPPCLTFAAPGPSPFFNRCSPILYFHDPSQQTSGADIPLYVLKIQNCSFDLSVLWKFINME